MLASLNHPNIAAIHGLEESGGVHALVLEFVEGPTLAERIARVRVPTNRGAGDRATDGLARSKRRTSAGSSIAI